MGRSPAERTREFAGAVTRGDLESAANCFARDACLITPDATAVEGREEIRRVLHQLILAGSRIEIEGGSFVVAGDVALGHQRWLISPGSADGPGFNRGWSATLVLRCLEGSWKLAVAAPWGRG